MERITAFNCVKCDIDALAYWTEDKDGETLVRLDCDECYHAYDPIPVQQAGHEHIVRAVYEALYDEEWPSS